MPIMSLLESVFPGIAPSNHHTEIRHNNVRVSFHDEDTASLGHPQGTERYIAFSTNGPWMRPYTGTHHLENLDGIQGAIIETKHDIIIIQAETSDDSTSTTIQFINDTIHLHRGRGWHRTGPLSAILTRTNKHLAPKAFGGPDEYYLKPKYLERLGYCTWNGLGLEVSESRIVEAVESITDVSGSAPGWVVIDDGWQKVDNERRLIANETSVDQFPNGLSGTVAALKKRGVDQVFVWTAILGYWEGISPGGIPGIETVEIFRDGATRLIPAPTTNGVDKYYDLFFKYLHSQHVSGVKVDVLDSLQDGSSPLYEMNEIYKRYRSALVLGAAKHQLELIWCGGMVPWVLQHRAQGPSGPPPGAVIRNSDDFFPNDPASHLWHVYCNIMNSVYTRQFGCVLDYDIFQTNIKAAKLHVAARILSGGPICITDEAGKHNPQIFKDIVLENNIVPSFRGPPRVRDPLEPFYTKDQDRDPDEPAGSFLEVVQEHHKSRLVAVFDIHQDPEASEWVVPTPSGCAAFQREYDTVQLVTHSPLIALGGAHFAVFGYVDKLSGIAAVESVTTTQHDCTVTLIAGGGTLGLQWPFTNAIARANGEKLPSHILQGVLSIKVPPGINQVVVEPLK